MILWFSSLMGSDTFLRTPCDVVLTNMYSAGTLSCRWGCGMLKGDSIVCGGLLASGEFVRLSRWLMIFLVALMKVACKSRMVFLRSPFKIYGQCFGVSMSVCSVCGAGLHLSMPVLFTMIRFK